MKIEKHKLISFDQSQVALEFAVEKRLNSLFFQFELVSSSAKDQYDFSKLFSSNQSLQLGPTARADELWKDTCLEFFLASSLDSSQAYFEFNLGKDLKWNLYQLDSYRSGLKACDQVQHIQVLNHESSLSIEWTEFLIGTPLFLSATAVLKTKGGQTQYHAIRHSSEKPDFHDRKSFVISI